MTRETPMKKALLALIALAGLTAACHNQKQDPGPDVDATRARSEDAHKTLDQQVVPQP
jgi:hypothetical protein